MNEQIIGLIPAAGKGLRLGLPYPKELYPIIRDNRYKPVSQFVVDNLVAAGVYHIVFVINETKHQLIGFFGNGQRFNCRISYVVQEQPDPSLDRSTSPGLSHALDAAYHLVRGKTVLFGMADTIMVPRDIFAQALAAARPGDDVLMVTFETKRPEKFGMVRVDDQGQVTEIVDKPRTTELRRMWGCIIWRPDFTEYLHDCVSQQGVMDFAQIMNSAISDGFRFRAVHSQDASYTDLGTYEEIAEMELLHREE